MWEMHVDAETFIRGVLRDFRRPGTRIFQLFLGKVIETRGLPVNSLGEGSAVVDKQSANKQRDMADELQSLRSRLAASEETVRERTESLTAAEAADALKATRIAELEAAAIAAEAAAAAAAATIAGLEQRVGLIQASHEKLGGLTVELVAVGLAAAAEEAAAKLRARSDQDKETRVVPANGGQCGPQPMCPVCWETPTDPVRLQCDHELCKACMRRWAQGGGKGPGLGAGAKCPVCRKVSNRRRLWEDPDDRRPKRRHTNAASAAPGGSRATCVHAPVAMQG